MNPVIEFSLNHPVVAALVGIVAFLALMLAGLSLLALPRDESDEGADFTYWD